MLDRGLRETRFILVPHGREVLGSTSAIEGKPYLNVAHGQPIQYDHHLLNWFEQEVLRLKPRAYARPGRP